MSVFLEWQKSWHPYLREHRKPATRALHYLQTIVGGAAIIYCVATGRWIALAIVIVAILINALIAHFIVEGNKPAAFGELFGGPSRVIFALHSIF